ncbi:hypothetical protein ACN28S_63790 [Cystobacter fuscus]
MGLKRPAEDLGALGAALARARTSGAAGDETALAETWASAALRTQVGHEQFGG